MFSFRLPLNFYWHIGIPDKISVPFRCIVQHEFAHWGERNQISVVAVSQLIFHCSFLAAYGNSRVTRFLAHIMPFY